LENYILATMAETEAAEVPAAELSEADAEIAEMQRKVQEMEDEADKLRQMTDSAADVAGGDSEDIDNRSVYVGQVDYGCTPEELQEHFKNCGAVNRITIMVNKYDGTPKGFAYIEFADADAIEKAMLLHGSLLRDRQLKVIQKRSNIPGFNKGKGKDKGKKGKGKGKKGKVKGKPYYDPYHDPYYDPYAKGKGKGKWYGPAYDPYGYDPWYAPY